MQLRADLDFAAAAAQRVADAPERRTRDVRGRGSEARGVGQVRRVAAELQLETLVDRDALQQRRIHLEVVRGEEEVAGDIAELSGGWSGELCAFRGIEVPQDSVGGIGKRRAVAAA